MIKTIDMPQQHMNVIRQMQNEIRGIQTGNQRILRHLFGEEDEN